MTPQEYELIMANSQMQTQMGMSASQTQQQAMFQEQERGLAEEQLDVNETIFNLYNLLQGKRIKFDKNGKRTWDENIDVNLRILSDEGIQELMKLIISYINKNKLLSNYSHEEIMRAMFDFTTELNDKVLLKYETLFYEPTFEECRVILEKKLSDKAKIQAYAYEILGQSPDIKQIKKELIYDIEARLEKEIQKIQDEERSRRIKEYGTVVLIIEHQVLDTYMRAEGGQERSSLRRHAQFTEVRALQPENPNKKGGMFSWLKAN